MRKLEFSLHTILYILLLLLLIFAGKQALILILIAQVFVGIYQVISSAWITFRIQAFGEKTQMMIKLYWAACLVYSMGMVVLVELKVEQELFYSYILAAWSIAVYYYYIVYRLAFPSYVKSHLDI